MNYYRLMLNFQTPLGEVEFRRTIANFPFKEKSLEINWDRNKYMPSELLKGEFSLTDESEYLDILKVSHLGWEGLMVNGKALNIFNKFKLQDFTLNELNVYKDNNEQNKFNLPYSLIHFHSSGSFWVEKIHYSRISKKSGEQQYFETNYAEFIDNEVNIPVKERISRKIVINKIDYSLEKFPNGFFDLFYNTFLFKTDFIISEKLRNALNGLSGFIIEDGPLITQQV